jgi:hypothetical protein
MRFKVVGVVLLLIGLYFAARGWLLADAAHIVTESAKVDVLIAIFLASTVRVLQAEKHYREQLRREHEERTRLHHPDLDEA